MSSSPEWRQGQQRSGGLEEHEGDFKASDSQHPQLPEVFPSPHPAPTSTAGLLIVPSSAMAMEQQQQQQDHEECSNLQALAQAAAEEAEKQQEDGAEHLGERTRNVLPYIHEYV